jgi:predicted RNA-binding protein Jag
MNYDVFIKETENFLTMMNMSYKEISFFIDTDVDIYILSLRVSGLEEELFVEHNNNLTRAIGAILKIIFQKKFHFYKDIILDVNGVNSKFINETKQKAHIALERVNFFDKPYEFGYLNAYERMLIHSYLKKHISVETISHGEGVDRRLVIKKK